MYRPPSEAQSLLLQVTVGCSHNRCSYCAMYRDKTFRTKPWAQVESDIDEATRLGPRHRRVFLCDGDALVLSMAKLRRVLEAIASKLPWIERVSAYGDTRSVANKSVEQLRELRELGLQMLYHGAETGDDEVMRFVDKGGTRADCVGLANKLRAAGIRHSVMVLLGVGGVRYSEQHARNTATLLTEMDPPFAGALTTTVVPGTPMFEQQSRGEFELPDKFGLLRELQTIIRESELSNCRFSANHASNYLPLRATLPSDKSELLALLSATIEAGDERVLKPEWLRGL